MIFRKTGLVIAHRGASSYAPENTLRAFELAAARGLDWVETDVMLTADQIPILHHDDNFERTTGYDALVSQTPLDVVQTLNAGNYFTPTVPFTPVPTLMEAVQFLKARNMGLNLELKPTPGTEIATAKQALEVLLTCDFPPEKLIISSFSFVALIAAYRAAPDHAYAWLCDSEQALQVGLEGDIPFEGIHICEGLATYDTVQRLRKKYQVRVYTVNDPNLAKHLFSYGVCAVFSDQLNDFAEP